MHIILMKNIIYVNKIKLIVNSTTIAVKLKLRQMNGHLILIAIANAINVGFDKVSFLL